MSKTVLRKNRAPKPAAEKATKAEKVRETPAQTAARILAEKYPGLHERLGVEPDRVLAEEHGITRGRIHQFRRALKIVHKRSGSAAPQKPKAETFRTRTFAHLRSIWQDRNPQKGLEDLATVLGTRAARITDWSSGGEGRQPPYGALVGLADELGMELRVDDDGIGIADPTHRADLIHFEKRRKGETF